MWGAGPVREVLEVLKNDEGAPALEPTGGR